MSLVPGLFLPMVLTILAAIAKGLPYARAPDGESAAARAAREAGYREAWFLPPDFSFLAAAGSMSLVIERGVALGGRVSLVLLVLALGFAGGVGAINLRHRDRSGAAWLLTVAVLFAFGLVVHM